MKPARAMFAGRERVLLLMWLALATGAMLIWTLQEVTPAEDLRIYLRSLDQALSGGNPYYPFQIGSFIYHPLVLTLLTPFARITWPWAWAIWTVLTVAAWLGSIGLSRRLVDDAAGPDRGRALAVGSVIAGALLAGPFIETAYSGQINVFVVLAVCYALVAAESARPAAAGASLAIAIVLKTSPVLLLAHFVSVRQFRVVLYCLAALAIFSVVPVVQFGTVLLASFFDVVQQINATVRVNRFNVGLVAGLYVALRRLDLTGLGGEFWNAVGYGTAALLGAIAVTNWFRGPLSLSQRISSFALVLTVLTVFSPLVWYHHFVFLLLPVLLLFRSSPAWLGVTFVTLVQSERLFESTLWGFPAPVLAAQALVFCSIFWTWFRRGTRAPEVHDSPASLL
jgi:hypothetical protein